MRERGRAMVVCGVFAVAALGCEPEPAAEAPPVEPAAEGPANAPEPVGPELLSQLKERYPVLREEPAPEPQPNGDADPDRVPERVRERLPERVLQRVTGEATFYANYFEGRRTASGIPFRQNQMVAAHRAYPFGTVLRVTNLENEQSVNVRVVDRGPYGSAANQRRTVLDLSRRAAQQLGYADEGRAAVQVEVLEWGPGVRGAV